MRIVTWNCSRGDFATRLAAARNLRPDVLLLEEAMPREVTSEIAWLDYINGAGIAALADNGYSIIGQAIDETRCGMHVQIDGPVRFDVIAIWTHPVPKYAEAAVGVIRSFGGLIESVPTIIAGSFNTAPGYGGGERVVRELESFGLVSAYHQFFAAAFGSEAHATHYWRWQQGRPLHTDFCFVPRSWRIDLVSIGGFDEWNALSDHRPITVDLTPAVL